MAEDAKHPLIPAVAVAVAESKPEADHTMVETKLEIPKDIDEQTPEQQRTLLSKLTTAANLDYNRKKYEDAAETYSQATELQALVNGEMSPDNADLLWEYGRCLFKVAIAKSNVLGGGVAGEDTGKKKNKSKKNALPVPGDEAESKAREEKTRKGLLMIDDGMGDDEDEEDEDEEDGEDEDEEEDDLAVAYEILDLARVLFEKQIDAQKDSDSNAGPEAVAEAQRRIKERLADVRDLQSEISLENERFDDAVEDSKATLILRKELLGEESELIAEANFKLALAYEFSFNTSLRDTQEDGAVNAFANGKGAASSSSAPSSQKPDPARLWSAVEHMTFAIQSCEARIAIEEKKLPGLTLDEKVKKEKDIAEVKDIVGDMVPRLNELLNSAKAFAAQSQLPEPNTDQVRAAKALIAKAADVLPPTAADAQIAAKELDEAAGVKENSALATIAGESKADRQARIQEASAKANDLSGLVKKKKKPAPAAVEESAGGGAAKRRLDDDEGEESEGKKMRVD